MQTCIHTHTHSLTHTHTLSLTHTHTAVAGLLFEAQQLLWGTSEKGSKVAHVYLLQKAKSDFSEFVLRSGVPT